MTNAKRLYRSRTNKKISGVCAGIGDYFNIDPTVVRVAFVLLAFISGIIPGILAYIVLALIIPEEDEVKGHG